MNILKPQVHKASILLMKIGNCIANICACYLICITWLRVKPNEAALYLGARM